VNEITPIGKRKYWATLSYTAAVFLICGGLVYVGKITGAEFVETIRAAGALVAVFLGANVVKGIWGKE
jgi:hypothetical protein